MSLSNVDVPNNLCRRHCLESGGKVHGWVFMIEILRPERPILRFYGIKRIT